MNAFMPLPLAETHLADVTLQYREEAVASGFPMWATVAILVMVVAGIIGAYKYFYGAPAIVNTPLGMLHELCKVHRIGTRGRLLLETVARDAALEHPAVLFSSPTRFDGIVGKSRARSSFSTRQQSTLAMVRRKIFS